MSRDFLESLFEVDGLNPVPDDDPIYQNATYIISFVSRRPPKPLNDEVGNASVTTASKDGVTPKRLPKVSGPSARVLRKTRRSR